MYTVIDKNQNVASKYESISELSSDIVHSESGELLYGFYEVTVHGNMWYLVSVELLGERALGIIGSKRSSSESFYEKIVKGEITPCTLSDVCEDLGKEYLSND